MYSEKNLSLFPFKLLYILYLISRLLSFSLSIRLDYIWNCAVINGFDPLELFWQNIQNFVKYNYDNCI